MIPNETQTISTVSRFVSAYKPYALATESKTGISHLFILAQAALESGWGKHAPNNMFFGIKADKNTPPHKKQLLRTTEVLSSPPLATEGQFPDIISVTQRKDGKYVCVVRDWFRKYDTVEECFTDHALFFCQNKRYAEALKVKADPYRFAEAIAQAGYATAPNYATQLKSIITLIKHK